ncbi:hypothetical protein EON79_02545 [bacterium]|nr:MAG: hypothetical protein EON79_02545 [bacterium]
MPALLFAATLLTPGAQTPRPTPQPTLGLESGLRWLDTPDYTLRLVNSTGVAVGFSPKGGDGFDFAPYDRRTVRASDGFYHLGDLTFRARPQGTGEWMEGSTATKRKPVRALPVKGDTLVAHDLTATLPENCPLRVTRRWVRQNGRLALLFDLQNPGKAPVEIGALGIPMPFNNIIMDRSLEEAHAKCSFTDPYIGADAGYLQVTQLTGTGPTMVVTPVGRTPLEAYRLLLEPMRPNQVFEGMMEWTVHSEAYAQKEWKGVEQWNAPTSTVLKPGQVRTYGVQFQPSPSVRTVEKTLAEAGRPVAVGLPGYVLPADQEGRLFLKYGKAVRRIEVEPKGALTLTSNREGRRGWRGYTVRAAGWGRARLTVTYADDTRQTVSYYAIKPAAETVADLGRFLTTKAWFTDEKDPFGRAPSAITYDREADRQVTQDSRVWISGLGDEGGSGNWLALSMKQFGQPDAGEVAKVEAFIDRVLWGNLQFKDGPEKFGVRKSVFYYDPALLPNYPYDPKLDWKSWTSWSKKATDDIGRGYNYPHVVAAYWSMYRVARNHPGLAKAHGWDWYLDQAYETTRFMTEKDPKGGWDRVGYWRLGLMGGDVFVALLDDLKREGWTEKAALIEARMKERADHWKTEAYPFGSEMAWDSTGQEEVYAWSKRFGYEDKAQVSLNSILAYMPTVPHWGYNGNARRYWDFLYGGTMGALSNIDREGFASAAFHSFPSTLKWDAYSGDYGPNFLGHAFNTGTYLVETPDFGWQAFGGLVSQSDGWVTVKPQDSFRKRIYLAPAGLLLTLDAGTFESASYDPRSKRVRIRLSEGPGRLVLEQSAVRSGTYRPKGSFPLEAGAFNIPGDTGIELEP